MASSAAPSAMPGSGRGVSRIEALGFLAFVLLIAWPFGVYTRPPFDDEIFTIVYTQQNGLRALFALGLTGTELHPFGSYAWFRLLADLGLTLRGMGAVSLLMTGLAFLLVLDLTLRAQTVQSTRARLTTLFLFATFPMLYGVGDALRWYPPFALLIAAFLWLELRGEKPTIGGGLALGLAASTNYLAIFAYLAFAVRRYLILRRFELRADGLFHLALLIVAWPGLVNFVRILSNATADNVSHTFFQHVPLLRGLAGLAETALGFFGGNRLGLFNSALALPYLALCALSIAVLARALWKNRHARAEQDAPGLATIAASLALLCILYSLLTSFDRARALLFVSPFVVGCMALGYWRTKLALRWDALPLALAAFVLFSAALAAGRLSDQPFKRNLAIPFDEVTQFVADNTEGDVLVASSETVTAYFLERADRCVVSWVDVPACLAQGPGHFRYVVLVRNQNFDAQLELVKIARDVVQHRALVARAEFGRDRTAALKSRLTGETLSPWLLTVEIYR